MVRAVLRPPELTDVDGDVVFLGGPIQDAPDWQADAIGEYQSLDCDVIVASPRKDYAPGEFVYEAQVDWETHFLRRAVRQGAVMFWLANRIRLNPERAYAQTTRFELAEHKMLHQFAGALVVVGIEKGFGNERYIRRRLSQDCPDIPVLDNLADTCKMTADLLTTR